MEDALPDDLLDRLSVALGQLRQAAGDAVGGAGQALALGVLADAGQELADEGLGPR